MFGIPYKIINRFENKRELKRHAQSKVAFGIISKYDRVCVAAISLAVEIEAVYFDSNGIKPETNGNRYLSLTSADFNDKKRGKNLTQNLPKPTGR